jgi:hypothetical protein
MEISKVLTGRVGGRLLFFSSIIVVSSLGEVIASSEAVNALGLTITHELITLDTRSISRRLYRGHISPLSAVYTLPTPKRLSTEPS